MFLHCIIHRNALAVGILPDQFTDILNMVVSIINKIKMSALYTRQFKTFCEDQGAGFVRLLHYSKVRWLSYGQMINRFYNLRGTILIFLADHNEFELSRFFHTNNFIQTIAYFSDIFSKFNSVNLVLQGNHTNIISLSNQINSFRNIITLWTNLISRASKMQLIQILLYPGLTDIDNVHDL